MTTLPGQDFIDAIVALNKACERIGVGHPTMIGMRTGKAIHAAEAAVRATHSRVDVRDVQGGFEVAGVAIKVRWD